MNKLGKRLFALAVTLLIAFAAFTAVPLPADEVEAEIRRMYIS